VDEAEFLKGYDAASFDRPSVAVDLVLMAVIDGAPAALLLRREEHPYLGNWSLPGGFVRLRESLDDAARRVLRDKASMSGAYIEQLYTFGAVERDPRMRVISVAYFALLPDHRFKAALRGDPRLMLARVSVPSASAAGGSSNLLSSDGQPLSVAFDHAEIIGHAMLRLRGKLDYSDIAFALLPERFTLRQLQSIHEAILGTRLNKPAFRRRMLDSGRLEATGERETGASFRPAELYRHRRTRN